ncbi:NAD(P)-binding domain-containing protein [Micromonospora saelicesensis]|uniref:NAD(P)-binding domain-containing protein n=1 Tax=Micromonospora saelicesensis TaxID=285676 RepID=UPI000DDB45A5
MRPATRSSSWCGCTWPGSAVRVREVWAAGARLAVQTDSGSWSARYVISATGTWQCPYLPDVSGREELSGRQLHTVDYASPLEFRGQPVVISGCGSDTRDFCTQGWPPASGWAGGRRQG